MIDAYEYLIHKGILSNLGKIFSVLISHLGTNVSGVYYLVIYGYAYTKAYESKEKIKIGEAF